MFKDILHFRKRLTNIHTWFLLPTDPRSKISIMKYELSKIINNLTISGKQVNCSTLVTETPVFSREVAVPPVETIANLEE